MAHEEPPMSSSSAPLLVQASIRSYFQSSKQPPSPAPEPDLPQRLDDERVVLEMSSVQDRPMQESDADNVTVTVAHPLTRSVAASPTMPTHHPNISISPVLHAHIRSLRLIVTRVFPIQYPASFYAALANPDDAGAFSRVLLWAGDGTAASEPEVIGGLVCRPEPVFHGRPNAAGGGDRMAIPNVLHIQALVLDAEFRQLGLATQLLDEVCRLAKLDERWCCRTVCAHVWAANAEAMRWYAARGFEKMDPVVAGLYKRLTPSDAWIMRRDI